LAEDEASRLSRCIACGEPFKKDDFSGLLYCIHCDLVLSMVPEGRTYMLLGGSGSGKSIFSYKLMDLYIRSSRPCVFVAVDESPSQLRTSMGTLIDGVEKAERDHLLTFVDCYSCLGGFSSQEKYHLDSPSDLNGLGFLLSKLVTETGSKAPVRLFMDSVTAMFAHCEPEAILKFLYSTSARVKNSGGSLIFTLNGGAVTPETQKRLEQLSDGLVEFRSDEEQGRRYYRFSKVRGKMYFDTWLPFFVAEHGVMLAPPEEPEKRERFFKTFELIRKGA
jgi:KaiC/GvpD/RAD55 family RecA-like ATPase